ncbi:MAG: aldehyde dehydrogenase family protein [Dehalococcoidia bacterium]|nr:aldehyde dehydrogenase family protein [Dehalococcoidia bacterium]
MSESRPYYIAGQWKRSGARLEVFNPYNGEVVGTTSYATDADVEEAVVAAERAFEETRRLSSRERFEILMRVREGMERRRDEIIRLIVKEAGKPLTDATAEFERALLTLGTAAEEAKRLGGEAIPLDWAPAADNRFGITRRFPIGPVLGISPFNFPLSLAMHKLAPAIAAGNPIVLKPASKTPLVMLTVAEVIDEAGLPPGAVSIFPVPNEVAERIVQDERFKLLTFTGSSAVGWRLKQLAGQKRVLLELGGNAGVIVDASAPLEYAIQRLLPGSFSYAGQSCISVQRIYLHRGIFEAFVGDFVEGATRLKVGDPMEPDTDLGPVVNERAAARIASWIEEAIAAGARVLTGGRHDGPLFEPTVLLDSPLTAKVCMEEAFAPLVVLFPFDDFRAAVREINRSYYGLQAGVFTRDLENAWIAFEELEVGGVIVNDVPTWRVDHMPYGGTKGSGLGREGPRYAIEEMTELKLMVINRTAWAEG